jgi:DNA-binding CsgD family transcriptional regulator
MAVPHSSRLGNIGAMTRVVRALPGAPDDSVGHKRKLIAEFCRLVGAEYSAPPPSLTAGLSPRHGQTLLRLLEGDSEKQVAARLGVSPHTVHVYVKALHRRFNVSSRGELLARFVHSTEVAPRTVSPE